MKLTSLPRPLGPSLGILLLLGGCVSTSDIESIQAQLSELQVQVMQLQQQTPSKGEVQDLEAQVGRQMQNLLQSEADMQVQLQDVSTQIDQLKAQLEDTNYRLAQVSQQIATTNQELKSFRAMAREAVSEDNGGEASDSPRRPGSGAGLTTDPESLYQSAYQDYTQGDYDLAIEGFEEYLRNFPETDLSDNATYWIGESYYRQGMYRRAIRQFESVLNRYPRSDKVPSALLKKGYAHVELGERSDGVSTLQRVVRDYPTSDEANLARQRLRELGASGG